MVDYDALYRALVDGQLAGAGLETFAVEPPAPTGPCCAAQRHPVAAHRGLLAESVLLAADMVCRDLAHRYVGRPTEHCFNAEVLARA